MRRSLLLISLLVSLGMPCAVASSSGEPYRTIVVSTGSSTAEVADTVQSSCLFSFSDSEPVRYTVAITFKKACFSGICVAKRMDGVIAGSIVNEFGIRAFDFKMSEDRRRVKLLNVMNPLDKCLIRKAVAHDLKRLFRAKATDEYVSVDEGGTIVMQCPNRRYCFSKMNIPE